MEALDKELQNEREEQETGRRKIGTIRIRAKKRNKRRDRKISKNNTTTTESFEPRGQNMACTGPLASSCGCVKPLGAIRGTTKESNVVSNHRSLILGLVFRCQCWAGSQSKFQPLGLELFQLDALHCEHIQFACKAT